VAAVEEEEYVSENRSPEDVRIEKQVAMAIGILEHLRTTLGPDEAKEAYYWCENSMQWSLDAGCGYFGFVCMHNIQAAARAWFEQNFKAGSDND
jgi:hypothetical protein